MLRHGFIASLLLIGSFVLLTTLISIKTMAERPTSGNQIDTAFALGADESCKRVSWRRQFRLHWLDGFLLRIRKTLPFVVIDERRPPNRDVRPIIDHPPRRASC